MKPWVAGLVTGVAGGALVLAGNPENMGICVACFERDIVGALGLHRALPVQAFRPEIAGLLLGAFIAAILGREFTVRSGSSPVTRLILGFFGMIGALVFLGCPWRAFLRLAGGDLNSIIGLAGLCAGIAVAHLFVRRGFSLTRGPGAEQPMIEGLLLPVIAVAGVALYLAIPSFGEGRAFFQSTSGPGSMMAPFGVSLGVAVIVGFLGFRSRFCSIAAFRNLFFFRDRTFLYGVLAMITAAFAVMFISSGSIPEFGFQSKPVSHSNYLWNFLGLFLAGICFYFGEGCPGRQLFKAGGGNLDSVMVITGMFLGAAVAHNFNLAAVPDKTVDGVFMTGGPSVAGMSAVVIGIVFCLILGFIGSRKTVNSR